MLITPCDRWARANGKQSFIRYDFVSFLLCSSLNESGKIWDHDVRPDDELIMGVSAERSAIPSILGGTFSGTLGSF